ncbi:MAG: hypothetical protein R2705_06045 [Ilumatobacteraceae bacterium]
MAQGPLDPAALFVDYNQNARDHTIAAVLGSRLRRYARVSAPITWDEIVDVDPSEFTVLTMPDRFARLGDLHAAIDTVPFDLAPPSTGRRDERDGAEPPAEPMDDDA